MGPEGAEDGRGWTGELAGWLVIGWLVWMGWEGGREAEGGVRRPAKSGWLADGKIGWLAGYWLVGVDGREGIKHKTPIKKLKTAFNTNTTNNEKQNIDHHHHHENLRI